MKALSLSRPWDLVVLHPPFKSVENRKWPTKFRGRIYVHRAKSWDDAGFQWLYANRFKLGLDVDACGELAHWRYSGDSGIVGEIDIVDCVKQSTSPWFFGPYGFILANPKAYHKPIPYRGMMGLFDVSLCFQCHTPTMGQKFCEKCSQVAVEDDCAPD